MNQIVLPDCPPPIFAIGHSMGGTVSVRWGLTHPDLFAAAMSSVGKLNFDIDNDPNPLADFNTGRIYRESLDRSIGAFGSFAAGVSYISILTGTFQLFYFGYGTAGPAYLWSWPIVLIGQLAVALCFMELAAKYPIAGSVYNWSKLLGSRAVGWSSGWLMLTASIVSLSAVVLALRGPRRLEATTPTG